MNLWQDDDFSKKHGLKPCAFLTIWNVRKVDGEYYLDMCLTQRSSDFMAAGCINQTQYMIFLYMMAREVGMKPGRFTWFYDNIQIYDSNITDRLIITRNHVNSKNNVYNNITIINCNSTNNDGALFLLWNKGNTLQNIHMKN